MKYLKKFFITLVVFYSFSNAKVVEIKSMQGFYDCISQNSLVYVKAYAPWCGPCRSVAPLFDEISNDPIFDKITFIKINIDNLKNFASEYTIKYLPSFVIIKNKKVIETIVGSQVKKDLHSTASRLITAPEKKNKQPLKAAVKELEGDSGKRCSMGKKSWPEWFFDAAESAKKLFAHRIELLKSFFGY